MSPQIILKTLIGKPLFVEKPGGLKTKQLLDIKKGQNQKYFLYNRRYYDSVLLQKNLLA